MLLTELTILYQMKSQIPSWNQIHYQVHVLSVLEGELGIYDEIIVETFENLEFVHNGLNTFFGKDSW